MLTWILFHLLGNVPAGDGQRVSAHGTGASLPWSQALPRGLSLTGRQLSPAKRDGAVWDGWGREGNPSPGSSSCPAVNNQPCGTALGNPTFPEYPQTCFSGCSACRCGIVAAHNECFFSVSSESETDVLLTKINSLMQE